MKKAFLFLCLTFLLLACSRISGKNNLEAITEIYLPPGYSVINEKFQKSGRDFFLQYDIKLNQDSTRQVIDQIKSSKYFSQRGAQLMYDSIWYVDNKIYKFEGRDEAEDKKYEVTFDPATGVLNYLEYSAYKKL